MLQGVLFEILWFIVDKARMHLRGGSLFEKDKQMFENWTSKVSKMIIWQIQYFEFESRAEWDCQRRNISSCPKNPT